MELNFELDGRVPRRISNSGDLRYIKDFTFDTRLTPVAFETTTEAQQEGSEVHEKICIAVSSTVSFALKCMPNITSF
jgi:hypothetical protein